MSDGVTLRPIYADRDLPVLASIYASTRDWEMAVVPWTEEEKARFLEQQFFAQHVAYATTYQAPDFRIIEVKGRTAGRLYLNRGSGEIRVVDIAIMPEFRNRGLGRALLSDVIAEAARDGRKVSINVEANNIVARRLYDSLGFTQVSAGPVYHLLEIEPAASNIPKPQLKMA